MNTVGDFGRSSVEIGIVKHLMILLMGIFVITACASQLEDRASVPLATLWYLVYGYDPETGECKGGGESTAWARPPERVIVPEFGYYCAGDEEYIDYALGKMKAAGISTVILSWNGWGDTNFDGENDAIDFAAVDQTINIIFQHLGDDMKAAILIEPFFLHRMNPSEVLLKDKHEMLNRVWAHYENNENKVFHWDGKPLLVTWSPGEGRWTLGDLEDDRFTFREWGVLANGADWEMSANRGLDGMELAQDGTIWVFPRFTNTLIHEFMGLDLESIDIDVDLQDGFYDRAWEKVYRNRDSVKMVVVYGWNPWAEMSSIEPGVGGMSAYGDSLLQKTRWYYDRFQRGEIYRPFELLNDSKSN